MTASHHLPMTGGSCSLREFVMVDGESSKLLLDIQIEAVEYASSEQRDNKAQGFHWQHERVKDLMELMEEVSEEEKATWSSAWDWTPTRFGLASFEFSITMTLPRTKINWKRGNRFSLQASIQSMTRIFPKVTPGNCGVQDSFHKWTTEVSVRKVFILFTTTSLNNNKLFEYWSTNQGQKPMLRWL